MLLIALFRDMCDNIGIIKEFWIYVSISRYGSNLWGLFGIISMPNMAVVVLNVLGLNQMVFSHLFLRTLWITPIKRYSLLF
ncbi:hypothetical protein EFM32_00405 [Lactiplantibacillus plantarum]|nr:hypothetical protein [Lactiplantibacillus plantarum]QAA29058.1 hypothetical protein C0682_10620 [Lactiplantibacillus plantarum]